MEETILPLTANCHMEDEYNGEYGVLKDHTDVSIVAIPDFLLETFEHFDIKLEDLYEQDNINKIIKNVSKIDLKTMFIANRLISEKILDTTLDWRTVNDRLLSGFYYSIPELINFETEEYQDFINIYTDRSKDINSIILNKDNLENNIYSIRVIDKTIFIVLHLGFGNYFVNENKAFYSFLRDELINLVFKYYDESDVINTSMFRAYLFSKVNGRS